MDNNNQHIRVIIAGGGTGGHIFPGLAIAAALRHLRPDAEILFVGANGKMEMQKVPAAGYRIEGIEIAGFNRSSMLKNVGLPFKLIKSYFQVRRILKQFSPDVVIGVGGYSSFPVLKIAQSRGITTFIHESNSLPGKSNLWLGRKAKKVFVATDGMEKYFSGGNISVSGNPVREEIRLQSNPKESRNFFGLKEDLKTVLVVGGSLGAKSINEVIAHHIDWFQKNNLQLIWQTGKNYIAKVDEYDENVQASPFIDKMGMAYGAADVVVARAGAMTITELITQKKASILIPYPFASEDHQTVNAKYLVDKGAALMIPDALAGEQLINVLGDLVRDDVKIRSMESELAKLEKPDAANFIANEILTEIKK